MISNEKKKKEKEKKSNGIQEFLWVAASNFIITLPCEFQDF